MFPTLVLIRLEIWYFNKSAELRDYDFARYQKVFFDKKQ